MDVFSGSQILNGPFASSTSTTTVSPVASTDQAGGASGEDDAEGEQSATVSNANIEEGGFELTDGQDAVNRCWGGEVNHLRSLDGLAV